MDDIEVDRNFGQLLEHLARSTVELTRAQQDEARRRCTEGANLAELARSYGFGKSTISRLQK